MRLAANPMPLCHHKLSTNKLFYFDYFDFSGRVSCDIYDTNFPDFKTQYSLSKRGIFADHPWDVGVGPFNYLDGAAFFGGVQEADCNCIPNLNKNICGVLTFVTNRVHRIIILAIFVDNIIYALSFTRTFIAWLFFTKHRTFCCRDAAAFLQKIS